MLFALCCKPGKEKTSPKMAKSMLKLQGYGFSKAEFFRALKNENRLIVNGFFEAGIDANVKNEKGETALTYSLDHVESEEILVPLIIRADINLRDDLGNSPIHIAVLKKSDRIIDLLLKKNADVNLTGQRTRFDSLDLSGKGIQTKGISALFAAVLRKRADLVEKLIKSGAKPNIIDSAKSVPLAEASFQRSANPKIVKLLLDNGADVNRTEPNGNTPLIYAVSNSDITSDTRLKIVKMLLAKGADKKIKNRDGENALFWAKKFKYNKLIELLK